MFYLSFPFTRFRLRLNRLIPCFSITPTQANLCPTRRPSITAQYDDAFLSRSFFFSVLVFLIFVVLIGKVISAPIGPNSRQSTEGIGKF